MHFEFGVDFERNAFTVKGPMHCFKLFFGTRDSACVIRNGWRKGFVAYWHFRPFALVWQGRYVFPKGPANWWPPEVSTTHDEQTNRWQP